MKVRMPLVALVAACLVGGLPAAAPAAASAASSDDAVATAAQKQKRITARTVNRKLNSTRKSLRTTRRRVNSARRTLRRLNISLSELGRRLGGTEGGLAGLLGAAPQLISSLQQLGTAVRDQIAPGLKALSDAVQNQIAPGLKSLSEFTFAQEYGAVAGRIELPAAAGGTVNMTPAVVSPDVPDSGNPATITAANVPINLATLPAAAGPAEISIVGAFRSNEADGAATGDPAGQMGGILIVTCLAEPTPGGCQTAGDSTFEPGELVCTAQTPESTFDLPDDTTTDQTLVNVQEKAGLTDTSVPDEDSQNILGSSCDVLGGGVYGLTFNGAAVDIPTSMSPGPRD